MVIQIFQFEYARRKHSGIEFLADLRKRQHGPKTRQSCYPGKAACSRGDLELQSDLAQNIRGQAPMALP
jgi:hypothetical protein